MCSYLHVYPLLTCTKFDLRGIFQKITTAYVRECLCFNFMFLKFIVTLFLLIPKGTTSRRFGYVCGLLVRVSCAVYPMAWAYPIERCREWRGNTCPILKNADCSENWSSTALWKTVYRLHFYSLYQLVVHVFNELQKVTAKTHEVVYSIFQWRILLMHQVNYVRNGYMTSGSCFFWWFKNADCFPGAETNYEKFEGLPSLDWHSDTRTWVKNHIHSNATIGENITVEDKK
jgi:hypothetical protein